MAVTYPKTNKEKAALYVNAIHEVRTRLVAIEKIQTLSIPDLFTYEFCSLQLRLACECFAIGCLAAQGDFETHRAYREEYSPIEIFKALTAQYPFSFPQPSTLTHNAGTWHLEGQPAESAITRVEVEKAWAMSGDTLHRASVKKYIKRTNATDLKRINSTAERFWTMITGHIILLADHSSMLQMRAQRGGDAMHCAFLFFNEERTGITVEQFNVQV